MALPSKDLKNIIFRCSAEEPSKNNLESSYYAACSFFLFKINYSKAVPKRNGWPWSRLGKPGQVLLFTLQV